MLLRGRFTPAAVAAALILLLTTLALAPLPPVSAARSSWTVSILFSAATLVGARATVRRLGPGDPARRFWHAIGFNALAVGLGYLVALAGTIDGPRIVAGPVTQALGGLGALALVVV